MKTRAYVLSAALAAALPLAPGALAEGGKPHVHGISTLLVAVESDGLIMELTAPGDDIVGFEHEAKTKRQKRAVRKALETLKTPSELFVINGAAGCRAETPEVILTLDGKSSDEHDKKHDHDHKAEADHKDDHDEEIHGEFRMQYHYKCQDVAKLTHIDLEIFDRFKRMQTVNVRLIAADSQTAAKLNAEKRRIQF